MYILRIHFSALIFHSVLYTYLPIPTTSLPSTPFPASVDSEEGLEGSAHSAPALRSLDREHHASGQAPRAAAPDPTGLQGRLSGMRLATGEQWFLRSPLSEISRVQCELSTEVVLLGAFFKKIIFNLIASREGIFKLYMQKVLKKQTLYSQKKSLKN